MAEYSRCKSYGVNHNIAPEILIAENPPFPALRPEVAGFLLYYSREARSGVAKTVAEPVAKLTALHDQSRATRSERVEGDCRRRAGRPWPTGDLVCIYTARYAPYGRTGRTTCLGHYVAVDAPTEGSGPRRPGSEHACPRAGSLSS